MACRLDKALLPLVTVPSIDETPVLRDIEMGMHMEIPRPVSVEGVTKAEQKVERHTTAKR